MAGERSGDWDEGRCQGMMTGWAYLMGAIMTIDGLLLGLLLLNVKWPRHSNKR